jgi:hypothetical protein
VLAGWMRSVVVASLAVVAVSFNVTTEPAVAEAAEKKRTGGSVAMETLTIGHEGMKGKKPDGLKARASRAKKPVGRANDRLLNAGPVVE